MTKLPPTSRMSWNVFPPSVLSSNTPPSKPTFGSTSDASRLKFCRNVNRTQQSSKNLRNHPSTRLSLTTAGSSMKSALGAVSAGGIGNPESDVTQSGGGPWAFVASQPAGSAGGVTPSKFSLCVAGFQQPGQGSGVGVGPTPPTRSIRVRRLSSREPNPALPVIGAQATAAKSPTIAAINKSKPGEGRNRTPLKLRF